ncbi:596_t:CDS:1, partial [Diversispora eburnea]
QSDMELKVLDACSIAEQFASVYNQTFYQQSTQFSPSSSVIAQYLLHLYPY